MKVRKFYPRQVLRKLHGDHKALDGRQLAAIRYGARKGRKLGISLMVGSTASAVDLAAAENPQQAKAILDSASTRVVVTQTA